MTRADEHLDADMPTTPSSSAGRGRAETRRWSRRRVLTLGLGGAAALVAAGVAGVELVSHGVLPGQQELDQLDGACSVAAPPLRFSNLGATRSGSFFSPARQRQVGYTIAWPPGHGPGQPTAVGRDAARVRGQSHQRAHRHVAGPGRRARGRRSCLAAHGHGDGGRWWRLLAPSPGRRPDGHGRLRAHSDVPAAQPRKRARTASAAWVSPWAGTAR